MSYKYEFDTTIVGDFRLSRDRYLMLQEAYRLLLVELETWNERAIENGALSRPYEAEVADLERMIEWGNHELKSNRSEIIVKGMSIGSLRYAKAALSLLLRKREEDYKNKVEDGWPDGALKSIRSTLQPIRDIGDSISYKPSDVLWEVVPREVLIRKDESGPFMEWDVFISHASEDKETFVRPLAEGLRKCGLRVWFDEFTLKVGDSLRRSIDRGLAHSRFGVVVLSPDFLRKEWPQKELDGLVAREIDGRKVILPVWHNISDDQLRLYSPTLADRVAVSSSKGLDNVIAELTAAMGVLVDGTNAKHTNPDQPKKKTSPITDLWVNTEYPQKIGLTQRLANEGYDLKWDSANNEATSIDFEGWEHATVGRPDGSTARLKIHDAPVVGGYLVLLKRKQRRSSN
jgi:hypothetical protein